MRPRSGRIVFLLLGWVCLLVLALPPPLKALETGLDSLLPHIDRGGYALEIDNIIVHSDNINASFIPASTIKILTGLMALEILGPQYRFNTHFFIDTSGNLFIQGEGDPFLVSENVAAIVDQLGGLGIKKVNTLYLDDFAFDVSGPPPGSMNTLNPYDAQSSALAVNFNSLPLQITGNGGIISGEKQTPFLPMMQSIGRHYRKGMQRVNVGAFTDTDNLPNTLRYTGELFTAFFKERGVTINNGFTRGQTPPTARHIFSYQSDKTVADLVRNSLHYSNNFIANQLFLTCGSRVYKAPATWEKSVATTEAYLRSRLHLDKTTVTVVDGSGLSVDNRITPAAMLVILNRFMPYADLLKRKDNILVKSGTLTGSYCYAGYFQKDQKLAPYVLFLNQQRNTRKKALELLHKQFYALTSSSLETDSLTQPGRLAGRE